MKARILQLVDSFNQGGSERQALKLTELLHKSGRFEVRLASLSSEGVLRAEVAKLGLGEIPSYPLSTFYDRNAVAQLRKFVSHLRTQKIDLIHTHDFYTNIFGMTAGALSGVRVRIASRRETTGMRTASQYQVQKFAFRMAHQVLANSESVLQQLLSEGVPFHRITLIHNGIEIDRVNVSPGTTREDSLKTIGVVTSAKKLVTIVANMRHEVKDYPTFLRAARLVSQAIPNVAFLLAGEGELQPSLEALATQLNVRDQTIFLGRCENVAHLLNASDVCVLSSRAEGFSNSILEYMAAGRAVVATDVGGAREAIVHGETGYLVEAADYREMAVRIISLLQNAERARAMGEAGRRIVNEKFSQSALVAKTEALYARLLNPKSVSDPAPAPSEAVTIG